MRYVVAAALLLATPAMAQVPAGVPTGDGVAGARIAQTWCANCHVVTDSPARAGDSVPSFPAIAARVSTTMMSLHVFLQTPHAQMPNFQLSRQEIDDVSTYLLGLRK